MIKERIISDIITAQKAGDSVRLGTLRMFSAAFQSREIEKRGKGDSVPLTDEDVMEILIKEAKKRTEAVALYAQGGREDLKKKEEEELEILYEYIPRPLSREEIAKVVDVVLADGVKDFPSAMKEASARLKGKADGKMVAEIVKEKLAQA
jgi:hypothetical protein